jgi:iron complex outermembrane receptor protein
MRSTAPAVAILATIWLTTSVFAQTSAAEYRLDIERQDIASALIELSRQTGLQIGYFRESPGQTLLVGPLRGSYTAEAAMTQLLSASGLSFERVNASTIAVTNSSAKSKRRGFKTTETGSEDQYSYKHAATIRLADARTGPEAAEGAQAAAAAGEASAGNSSADNRRRREPGTMEEVIVTARKRAENLQDVPLSIAAITAEQIDRRGLFNAADYLRGIPGTNQVEGGPFGQSIVIRGIETSPISQNFNSGTTTATYFGETPTSNSAGLAGNSNVDIKLVDIERVEVLRGPQGTAFGNSSLGGAVRTIPTAPRLDSFESRVSAGYSATSGGGGDNYNAQAIANIPLIVDKLAIRAVGYKYEDSGFYRNHAASDPAFQAAVVVPFGAQAFAVDEQEVGAYDVVGGRVAALFQATDDLQFSVSYLKQKNEADGIAMSNSGVHDQTLLQVAPQQVRRGQTGGFYDSEIDLINGTVQYDFGRADLLTTYSYIDSRSASAFPNGYLGQTNPQSSDAQSSHRENVAEVRLSTRLEGAWNFLGGLYYEEIDDGAGDPYFQSFYFNGTLRNPFPGAPSLIGVASDRRELQQKAAFGEVSWRFLPALTLTGGARYYDYERTRLFVTSGPLLGSTNVLSQADATGTNFRGTLSYNPIAGVLLYAGWSEGFRLGIPTGAGLPVSICDVNNDGIVDGTNSTIDSTKSLNSDEVESFELGGKFVLLDRRLTIDAALFRTDWSGMPVTVTAPPPPVGCARNYQANAGAARSEGVELQASLQVADPLRIDFGGSWIDATLTEAVPSIGAPEGNRLAGVPEINANLGFEYGFDIGEHRTTLRADSIYVGSFYGNVLEGPFTKAGEYVKVDVRARIEFRNLDLDLYVHNVTDEDAFSFRRPSATTSVFFGHRLRPRTVGLQLNYDF